MSAHPESEDRLLALRAEDHFKIWKSLEDQRVCILCEKRFNGHEVEITWSAQGGCELHCPTKECNSGPYQWVYPGSLLISDIIGPDWWRAIGKERDRPPTEPSPLPKASHL